MDDLDSIAENFRCFVDLALYTITGEQLGTNPYLDHLCHEIEVFARGGVKRLLINLPPRHLKTVTASVCGTAWILGRAASTKIMIVTNSEELCREIMRKIQTVMRSTWYQRTFRTRLEKRHQAIMNFGTTAGGGVYSAPIRGRLTGFGADVIIVDDLHDIDDARNPEKMADDIDLLETVLTSRFDHPSRGRMMIIAHRIAANDVSGHVLSQRQWRHVVLPLVATRDEEYETANGPWLRGKGELLRPDDWDSDLVDARRARTRAPDFETLYQQNPSHGLRPIRSDYFKQTTWAAAKGASVVMSIDPGQGGGSGNSFGVIQLWSRQGEHHVLIAQFREQCPFLESCRACQKLIHRYRPSAILIEMTGQGPSLASKLRFEAWMKIGWVYPQESKAERLARHIDLICSGAIHLAIEADAQIAYIEEFVSFPTSDYTDQIDATTQYLDFVATCPHLEVPPERALGQVALRSTWFPAPPSPATSLGLVVGRSTPLFPSPQAAAAALARMSRRRR